MRWWELPGPSTFVEEVVNDLRDGRNVLVCLPENVPAGIGEAIRAASDRDSSWNVLSGYNAGDDLVEWLYRQLGIPGESPHQLRNLQNLVKEDGFLGLVLWVDDLSAEQWPCWRTFLDRYQHVCREIDLLARTVFCVALAGESCMNVPREDVCLSIRKYDEKVSALDQRLYVARRAHESGHLPLTERLRLEIVSSLAVWDGTLADELLKLDLPRLLDPFSTLQALAEARGWNGTHAAPADRSEWAKGISQQMEGRTVLHTCIHALRDKQEIRRRIWRAQLQVLYPYVEEQRQILLTKLRRILRVPYTTRTGEEVKDVRDLEIGHMEALVRKNGRGVDSEFLDRIACLRKIRNSLAHLEVVDFAMLNTQAITDPLQ